MDPVTVALAVLSAAAKAYPLIVEAVAAARSGDDSRSLELLNQALDHYDAGAKAARDSLAAVIGRVDAKAAELYGKAK